MEAVYEETEVKIITEEVESCYTLMEVSSPKRRKKNKGQGDKADKEKKPRYHQRAKTHQMGSLG